MLLEGSELTKEDRESQLYDDFEHFRQHKEESIDYYYIRFSKLINDMRNIKMTMPKLQLNSKFVNNMLQEWGYGEAHNRVGNVNQGQAKTMKCYNCNVDPITDEAGPSYDSDILSEVQDHDQYLDDTCIYQEEHVMHDSVQLDHVVDLQADHTSVSNMIPYDQYVKDNDVSVVHSNASSVPNDTFMMIYDD
nr:integrase, catalytic region, zinc finger, CCHC-type, peptidase aspartic, catalytic [Tanacetum cinerariifolium]